LTEAARRRYAAQRGSTFPRTPRSEAAHGEGALVHQRPPKRANSPATLDLLLAIVAAPERMAVGDATRCAGRAELLAMLERALHAEICSRMSTQ